MLHVRGQGRPGQETPPLRAVAALPGYQMACAGLSSLELGPDPASTCRAGYVTRVRAERGEVVRAEPFEAIEIAFGTLFGDDPLE